MAINFRHGGEEVIDNELWGFGTLGLDALKDLQQPCFLVFQTVFDLIERKELFSWGSWEENCNGLKRPGLDLIIGDNMRDLFMLLNY